MTSGRLDDMMGLLRLTEPDDNIVHWSEFDRGRHFATMEETGSVVEDVRAFFCLFR